MLTRNNKSDQGNGSEVPAAPSPRAEAAAGPDPNGLYQKGRLVARVKDPRIDEAGKEVRFTEIYESNSLLLADECEFRHLVLLVRRIAAATKENNPSRSRTLQGVVAKITGYRNN